jgi:glycosyltransferase involved in cell wall biosynthesis
MPGSKTSSLRQRWARAILASLHTRKLVTFEQREDGSRLLLVTNLWPHEDQPTLGPFIRNTADGLRREGLHCDVLFIRGFRSPLAYLAGALASALMPVAYPHKYLLVHCHGGETALAARFFLGAPVLASYLGTDILGTQLPGTPVQRLTWWLRSRMLRAHAATMSATTTKSVEMERKLLRPARNTVIADGVDLRRFRPKDRDQARARLGWPTDRRIVLFAGRAASPEKRLWLAEQAIEIAATELPDIELRIASAVPPEEMPLHYAAADCLLHTSASEGSPNVIKEALACNLAVVATPAGDVREQLADVRACAVTDAGPTALARALLEVLRPALRSDGREHVRGMSLELAAQRTVECYRSLGFPTSISRVETEPTPDRGSTRIRSRATS